MSTFFWSNNGTGDNIQVKDVVGVLDKYDEPACYIELITKPGKIRWEYSSVKVRDADLEELRKLRDQ